MKIIEEPYLDARGKETTSLYLKTEGQYVISEFIELLQAAKEKYGDKTVNIYNISDGSIRGFSHVCFTNEYDEKAIYGPDCEDESSISIVI